VITKETAEFGYVSLKDKFLAQGERRISLLSSFLLARADLSFI
jgi:hypothetical protein